MLVRPAGYADAGATSCRSLCARLACQRDRSPNARFACLSRFVFLPKDPMVGIVNGTSPHGRRDAGRRHAPTSRARVLLRRDGAPSAPSRSDPVASAALRCWPRRGARWGAAAVGSRLRTSAATRPPQPARRPAWDAMASPPSGAGALTPHRAGPRHGLRWAWARACLSFCSAQRRHLVDMSVRACSYCVARASGPTSALAREATRCSR